MSTLGLSIDAAPPEARYLRKHLVAAHALLGRRTRVAELSVAAVRDRTMSRLHRQFMGIAGPTDVLTFELENDARGRVVSGEVIINIDEAARSARREGVPIRAELLLYALHGLLHLSGYDDKTARGFAAMHRREDQLLGELGIGPVFDRGKRER